MTMMNRPRVALAAALLLLLPAACDDPPDDKAHGLLTGAGKALRAARSATVHFDVKLGDRRGNDSVRWKGTTAASYEPAAATTEATGDVVTFAARPGHVTGTQRSTVDLREVTVGDARYHRSSRLKLPSGRQWLKLTSGKSVAYGTALANPDLGVLDPMPFLDLWSGISPSQARLSDTGKEETVDGTRTRIYVLTCEIGDKECASSAMTAAFSEAFGGRSVLTSTLWLDDQGRPRKLTLQSDLDTGRTLDLNGTSERVTVTFSSTMTITGLGQPVQVVEPPAAQVSTDYEIAN